MAETDTIDFENDQDAIKKMRALFRGKGKPKERKEREKSIRAAVDGRSLRATGRTVQFNLKCREEIKAFVCEMAKADGVPIAVWFERIVETMMNSGALTCEQLAGYLGFCAG